VGSRAGHGAAHEAAAWKPLGTDETSLLFATHLPDLKQLTPTGVVAPGPWHRGSLGSRHTLKTDLVEPPAIQDRPLMAFATAPMGRK